LPAFLLTFASSDIKKIHSLYGEEILSEEKDIDNTNSNININNDRQLLSSYDQRQIQQINSIVNKRNSINLSYV
jgi:hypothetical protein